MRDQCIAAVERGLGRPLTVAESRNIESRIRAAMRVRAGKDAAAWRAMSEPQRVIEAAKMAAKQFVFEHQKKKEREGLSAVAAARLDGYTTDQVLKGADKTKLDAFHRTIRGRNDQKNNIQSIEGNANGMRDDALRRMRHAVETMRPGLWEHFPWENEAIAKEVIDTLTGVQQNPQPEIAAIVKAYREVRDEYVEMFNAEGGAIGSLDNYDIQHAWSPDLVVRNKASFIPDFMQAIDRSKYVNIEDNTTAGVKAGDYYTDAQMQRFLEEAQMTIGTGGFRKDRGMPLPGGGTWANRHAEHRQIHLKPEYVYPLLKKYTDRNILETMTHSIHQIARDVAVMQQFGPNADRMFETKKNEYLAEALESAAADGKQSEIVRAHAKAQLMQADWDNLTGKNVGPGLTLAQDLAYGKGARAIQTITHLGNAVVAAVFTDPVFLRTSSVALKLPWAQRVINEARMVGSEDARGYARSMGLMAEASMDAISRFASDDLVRSRGLPKLASQFLKYTGLHFATEVRRAAFGITMMDKLGELTRKFDDIRKLDKTDEGTLKGKGVEQKTWDIWRAAELQKWGVNGNLLTPEAIEKVQGYTPQEIRKAVFDLLTIVQEETHIAVIQPGLRERTYLSGTLKAGTPHGEIAKTLLQLKSFPFAVMNRHWERALAQTGMQKLHMIGALVVYSTIFGAIYSWANDLKDGKNPRNMNVFTDDPKQRGVAIKNVLGAFLSGGGGGFLADFFLGEARDPARQSTSDMLTGPTLADVARFNDLTIGNVNQALSGQETDFPSEAVDFMRANTPNTWYTRAIMDRVLFNQLQEWINPGYVDRMMDRQYQRQGTEYWWNPGDVADAETPDLESAWAE